MKKFEISYRKYIELKEPEYIFIKVIPSTAIRNYNSDKIVALVNTLYRDLDKRIRIYNSKLFFECETKMSFYMYIEKSKAEFYFIVPKLQYNLFKDKIIDTWSNRVTLEDVQSLPLLNKECTKYYLTYRKENAMSLTTDKRNNALLESIFATVHVLDKDEKLGVFYNFAPCYQKSWRSEYERTINKLLDDLPIFKNKVNIKNVVMYSLVWLANLVDVVLTSFSSKNENKKSKSDLMLSNDTLRKKESIVVKAKILCMSESYDKQREENNAICLCQTFDVLESDNKLLPKKYCKEFYPTSRLPGVESMKLQIRECQNFVSLPGRELLQEHSMIEHTEVLENKVPIELQSGYISLGKCKYKDTYQEAFLRDNWDQGNFPLVLVGEQGSGKTTYISNYVKCIQTRGEGAIIIDYIKNCELSNTIKNSCDNVIELDFSDVSCLQGIGYNELVSRKNDLLDISSRKSLYIGMLIDALNTDGEPLSTSMDRYLSAASNVVFLNSNASLKDVVRCLNNHEFRKECIDRIPMKLYDALEDEISALWELDDISKDGRVVGTRITKIDGINHRINTLRKDYRLKTMFNKKCNNNINLVEHMDKGNIILVKMPQEYFATPYSKNVIVTYLFTKIWSSMLVRGGKVNNPKRFHVITDEIFQCKTAMQLLKNQEILPQTRKFGCKFVFSCQYLGQINAIDQTLRSAGASYMLMKGTGKANFKEFKEELDPYTLEDLESLPQYSSLNLINYEKGRSKFVTKLPNPL